MDKEFVIKEAWVLDENGNKLLKLTPLEDPENLPKCLVNFEDIRGGAGKNNLLENKSE